MAGDGCIQNGRAQYYTSSMRLADDIQELFLKLGVTASIRTRKPEDGGSLDGRTIHQTVDRYIVTERTRPIAYLSNHDCKPNFKETRYEGKVYCAAVQNGTLITRRNGRPLISGNSLEYLVGYVWPLMEAGQAYHVGEQQAPAPELPPFLKAYLDEHASKQQTVHLGPGLSAA